MSNGLAKGLAVVGLGYLGYRVLKGTRPKAVSAPPPQCSLDAVVAQGNTAELSEQVYAAMVGQNDDPWDLSDAIMEKVAPQCRTSTQDMRDMAELNLYRNIFIETINRLLAEGRIDQDLYAVYKDEVEVWLVDQAQKIGG